MSGRRLKPAGEIASDVGASAADLYVYGNVEARRAIEFVSAVNPDVFAWLRDRLNLSVDSRKNISDVLRQVVAANGSQKETARVLCISPQYLSDILAGRREISAHVAEGLGFERIVTYADWRSK